MKKIAKLILSLSFLLMWSISLFVFITLPYLLTGRDDGETKFIGIVLSIVNTYFLSAGYLTTAKYIDSLPPLKIIDRIMVLRKDIKQLGFKDWFWFNFTYKRSKFGGLDYQDLNRASVIKQKLGYYEV